MQRIGRLRQRHPVAWMIGLTLALFVMFELLPAGVEDRTDVGLTLLLTVAFVWAVILMIRRTRVWTLRGQGMLGTVTGDALLYLAIGAGAMLVGRAHLLDLTRAALTVGVVHLLIGLLWIDKDEDTTMDGPVIVENVEEPRPQGEAS